MPSHRKWTFTIILRGTGYGKETKCSTSVVLNLFAEGNQIQTYKESRTKEILTQVTWHKVCHTKYQRFYWKTAEDCTKGAWEPHAALRTVVKNHCSTYIHSSMMVFTRDCARPKTAAAFGTPTSQNQPTNQSNNSTIRCVYWPIRSVWSSIGHCETALVVLAIFSGTVFVSLQLLQNRMRWQEAFRTYTRVTSTRVPTATSGKRGFSNLGYTVQHRPPVIPSTGHASTSKVKRNTAPN